MGRYVADLTRMLAEQGHELVVIHEDEHALVTQKQFPEHFIERIGMYKHPMPSRKLKQVKGVLDKFRPDILHIHGIKNFDLIEGLSSYYPIVKTMHSYEFCPTRNKFHRVGNKICTHPTGKVCKQDMLFKRCAKKWKSAERKAFYECSQELIKRDQQITRIITHTKYLKEEAILSGYSQEQMRVVPFYVSEPSDFIGLAKADNQILYCGGLSREGGLEYLIRDLASLPRRPRWTLKIVGAGHELEGIKKLAHKLKIRHRLAFSSDTEGASFAKHIQESLLVAIPSLWPEPYGRVALEALNNKKLVIAYRVGGIPEWIRDEETGLLVKPGDRKAFLSKISSVLETPGAFQEMAKAGSREVRENLTRENHAKEILAIYKEAQAAAVGLKKIISENFIETEEDQADQDEQET